MYSGTGGGENREPNGRGAVRRSIGFSRRWVTRTVALLEVHRSAAAEFGRGRPTGGFGKNESGGGNDVGGRALATSVENEEGRSQRGDAKRVESRRVPSVNYAATAFHPVELIGVRSRGLSRYRRPG